MKIQIQAFGGEIQYHEDFDESTNSNLRHEKEQLKEEYNKMKRERDELKHNLTDWKRLMSELEQEYISLKLESSDHSQPDLMYVSSQAPSSQAHASSSIFSDGQDFCKSEVCMLAEGEEHVDPLKHKRRNNRLKTTR